MHDRPDGITRVMVNGVPSSTIQSDPEYLEFSYMRDIAGAISAWEPPEKLLAVHLGGAACTLPRYLCHRYPSSRHVVVEVDAELARLARQWQDLPRAPQLRIRVGDALEVMKSRHDDSADVIVRDAFVKAATPPHLTGEDFWSHARRVTRGSGIVTANIAVNPGEDDARVDARTAAAHFRMTVAIGHPLAVKGSRRGNVVLIAGDNVAVGALERYASRAAEPTIVVPRWGK